MIRLRWLHNLLGVARSRKDRRHLRTARNRKPVRLRLERLEERLTPSYDVLKLSGASAFYGGVNPIAANQPSGAIEVQLQDNHGNAVTAASDRTVILSSSSATGQFLDLSGKPLSNNSIIIPTGSSFAFFEYQDSQTGSATITADISKTSVLGQTTVSIENVLAFTTPSQVTAAGQPTQAITIQLQDGNGNPVAAARDTLVSLNSTSKTSTFLDTSGKPLAGNSITIAAGSSSASFEYEDSQAQPFGTMITASVSSSSSTFGISAASASQTEYVGAVGAITTPTQTIAPNQASKPITIQLQNAVSSDTTINLSTTSSTGTFLDTSGNPLSSNSIIIPAGSRSASFEYEDSQAGNPSLEASSSALNLFATVSERIAQSPGSLVFITPSLTLTPGQASQPITVQLQSGGNTFAYGTGTYNTIAAANPVTVTLSSSSLTGKFLDSAGNPLAGNSIIIPAGASSASFEYEDSQVGLPALTATMGGSTTSPTQTENVGGVSLAFTTTAQTLTAGQPSGTITVQEKDSNGKPITSGATLILSSNSSTGKFLDTSGNPLTSNTITIPAGSSSASFEYEDTVGGNPTLTATIETGYYANSSTTISATQQETVTGPYTITMSLPGQAIVLNKASQPFTVNLLTSTGTAATAASAVTVNLSSSSGSGQFLDSSGNPLTGNSITIAAGSSSASFEYEDSQAGFPTLSATENGITIKQGVNVGVSLVFTTSPQTLAAGQNSQPVALQLQDSNGNAFAAPSDINVYLYGSTQGVQFLDTNGKALSPPYLTISAGSSSASFEFNSTWGGTPSLTATASSSTLSGLSLQASQKETVQGPSALVFTTSSQTIAAGQMSQTVTVQLQDNNGNPVNAPSGGLNLNLSSYNFNAFGYSNPKASFFDADGNPLAGNTITMAAGTSTVSFKFETTTAGSDSIAVGITNGFTQSQQETVQPGALSSVAFVTPQQSLVTGVPSGNIVVQLVDKYGNPIQAGSGGATIDLSSSSSTGQFLSQSGDPLASASITIPAGANTTSFEYEDSQAGTPTLTATASGVSGTQQATVAPSSAEIHVTNTNDSGSGSLRAAIAAANDNPGSTIVFDSGVTGTIDLLSDLPYLQASTNIIGPGANLLTIEAGSAAVGSFGGLGIGTPTATYNAFGLPTAVPLSLQPTVTVTGLTVANFKGTGISNYGSLTLRQIEVSGNQTPPPSTTIYGLPDSSAGGISNSGVLAVLGSTVADNSTTNNYAAAGINSANGTLIVINSTIAGNTDNNSYSAGGIGVSDGSAYIGNSTISGNTASQSNQLGSGYGSGGGIDSAGLVLLYDTIVAGNTGSPANPTDVYGTFTSLGNNLIGEANSQSLGFIASDLVGTAANPIDANLGPLANNGGSTPTMTLLTGSPALTAGSSVNAPATDQRGDPRPQSGAIDIGSVEITTSSNSSGPSITINPSNQSVLVGQTATFTAAATGDPTPTVQWEFSTGVGNPFNPLNNGNGVSGATTGTLTLSNVTADMNGYQYEAVFTNTVNGTAESATTNPATLTVTTAATPPNITTQPSDATGAVGGTVSFTAAASGSPTPTVQWEVSTGAGNPFNPLNNGNGVSGATTPTLTLTNLLAAMSGYQYEAVFTNTAGSATTNAGTLSVAVANSGPIVTRNPTSLTATVGQTVTFTASATGKPSPGVTWEISTNGGKSFRTLYNGNGVSGATTTTLTLQNVSLAMSGSQYRAFFANTIAYDISNAATLTVHLPTPPPPPPPPTLIVPPLLQLFNSLLGGVETINADGTETITDSIFGIQLLVSTFDSSGHLMRAELLGIDITFLFTLFP